MESMRVVSVNLGRPEELPVARGIVTTGINKQPVTEPTWISEAAVGDDAICNTQHHGGLDQAVYVYSVDDYQWWQERLGREIAPGTFGENLTISGLTTELYVGDRLLVGDVVLEATSPRIPCATLTAKMQDPQFGLEFRFAERPGTYFRVMNEGEVRVGDPVILIDNPGRQVSILELFRYAFKRHHDANDLRRFLDVPVSSRFRSKIEAKLQELGG